MAKYATDIDVIKDLYNKLIQGRLNEVITGGMYLKKRPPHSHLEDCVVSFLSGRDGKTQTGVVTCNVFVPNKIIPGTNGYKVEDYERTQQITIQLNSIIHNSSIMQRGRYLWIPNTMVSTLELEQADEHAHFVHVEMQFSNNICYESESYLADKHYGFISIEEPELLVKTNSI